LARNDVNILSTREYKPGTSEEIRIVGFATHDEYTEQESIDAKAAAETSLAALDTWYAGLPTGQRKSWYQGLPSTQREHIRQGLLRLQAEQP
jgi:hypothetical protein